MKNKGFKIFSVLFLLVLFIPMLSGCQSTDKTMSYLNTGPISEARFDYDSIKDKTTITWTATLTNETIYNIKDFSVKLDLYNEETLVDTKTYYYSCSFTHGKQYTGTFTFTYNGRIDNIEYKQHILRFGTHIKFG